MNTGFSGTYRFYVVMIDVYADGNADNFRMLLNGDTTAGNYFTMFLPQSTGTAISQTNAVAGFSLAPAGSDTTIGCIGQIIVPNYSNKNQQSVSACLSSCANAQKTFFKGQWAGGAISGLTSITVECRTLAGALANMSGVITVYGVA
jgi:hypothetical protein